MPTLWPTPESLLDPVTDRSGSSLRLALVTPARNEAQFIEQTIQSVIGQTIRPVKWVIVSDGSTDGTDGIVACYLLDHPWIELIRTPERRERHFAAKVHAFNAGYSRLAGLDFDIVGNLDADITFNSNYFQFLLARFAEDPQLGVAGTPFFEDGRSYNYRFTSLQHVSGACQLFRKECFESIGGYTPIETGGVDLVAVVTSRMKGWQTRTFMEQSCIHHRSMGTAKRSIFASCFHGGYTDYTHGCDLVWELFRSLYQMSRGPIVLGGGACLAGYIWALATTSRVVSDDIVEYRKLEQRRRLRDFMKKVLSRQ